MNYSLSIENGKKGKIPQHIPASSTIQHVLKHCVDLRGLFKKMFLLHLSRFTEQELERRILEYLCSKEGSNDYTIYILEKRLSLCDIFHLFPSCKPPVQILFEHLPRLLPRPYSIANSPQVNPNIVRICFSVMETGVERKGLTTGWLEDIISNDMNITMKTLSLDDTPNESPRVPIYLRKNVNNFVLPDHDKPIILIGPGTGVSPFIGFLQERESFKNEQILGSAWLFFGCRNAELDYIYKEELERFLQNGVLSKLCTAFSRSNNCEFKYVQDAIYAHGEEVVKLLRVGAYVYLAGDVKNIATQVKDVLIQCIAKHNNCSKDEAKEYLTNLEKNKRYLVDIWN
ncbi:methionine synthase reductase-like isoform X2 [Leptidea sinapis]|nr:methionine synthase reductase-like isoform X2 [Leptidea sinapis]XP_050677903.1 methionine synthase reductase-like isoform X2 [Leptidea sinapis]